MKGVSVPFLKQLVSIAALAAMTMPAGCHRDCIDCGDEPPTVIGNYTGIYQFTEIENGVDTVVDTTQLIEWTFRQSEYAMEIDASVPESLRVFCDVQGVYELGNGVDLRITDSSFVRSVCPQYWGPGGYFDLNQTTDTLSLLNDRLDSLGVRRIRHLRLVNID